MVVACWAAKGGVGTTVVAAALALLLAQRSPSGAVLTDLAGDGPAVLGVPEPASPGLSAWLAADDDVPADALARIEVEATPGLTLLPRGPGTLAPRRAAVLAALLAAGSRPVVIDCGTEPGTAAVTVIGAADRSLLVTRACYLALRRVQAAPLRASHVVLVRQPGQVLGRGDVEAVADAPVLAEVELDPAVVRAVDAGLLAARRLPRSLERGLRHAL